MSPVGCLVFNTSEAPIVCLVGSTPTSSATPLENATTKVVNLAITARGTKGRAALF